MEIMAFMLAYIVPAAFAAIGCSWIGASAMKAAGRNPEKINDLYKAGIPNGYTTSNAS